MPIETRGLMAEAMVSFPVAGTAVTGLLAEAMVSFPVAGTGVTGLMAEAMVSTPSIELRGQLVEVLVSSPETGLGLTGQMVEVLVSSPAIGLGWTGQLLEVLVGPFAPPIRTPGEADIRSFFRLVMRGEDPPPKTAYSAFDAKVGTWTEYRKQLLQGDATDQMIVLFRQTSADEGQLGAGATRDIDLLLATDAYNEAIVADDVCLVFFRHVRTSTASSVSLKAAASDGWTNLLATTADLTLRPGDFVLVGAFTAGNLVVGATNRILTIENDDGVNPADYEIEIWGR
jgi:hypothetical protein